MSEKFKEYTVGALIRELTRYNPNAPIREAIWNDVEYEIKLRINVQQEKKDFACVTIGICADDPDWANTWDGVVP